MSELPIVLVVEDEPVQLELVSALLRPYYTIITAQTAAAAQTLFAERKPNLILLDKRLPDMDGAQLCRTLRQDAIGVMPPVLFVSAEITLDDRLAAYSAGGEDYIPKPFEPTELLAKIDVALRNVAERQRLESSAKSAFTTAMTAMSSASEIGVVLNAMREGFQAKTHLALAQCILNACENYQLTAAVQIRGTREIVSLNKDGVSSGLLMETLAALAHKGRIFSIKNHIAFNYGSVTIFISEIDDPESERTGRMRDNLALLAEGIDVRAQAIENEIELMREHQHTLKLFTLSTIALQEIDNAFQQQFVEVRMALTNMIENAEEACFSLGLTENQEKMLSQQLRQTENKLLAVFERGLDVKEHLTAIQKLMESRVSKE